MGLKGTDFVADEALRRGALPVAPAKAREMLSALAAMQPPQAIRWLTPSGPMGEVFLKEAGFPHEVAQECAVPTTAEDTKRACHAFLERAVELIVFVGGDGTARDVASAVDGRVPIVGVPSGVKMHSAVFGLHPASIAAVLLDFVRGQTATVDAEVLDIDETRYRRGEWVVRLFATVKTVHQPTLIQRGKMMFEELHEDDARDAIAEHLIEEMDENPDEVYLLGPGGTLRHVKEKLGLHGSPLGIDAVRGKRLVEGDLDEVGVLRVIAAHPNVKLVLSPIGSQGFLLGRGNLELTPDVVRRIGLGNVIVVATPDKLWHTPALHIDTGDARLDEDWKSVV